MTAHWKNTLEVVLARQNRVWSLNGNDNRTCPPKKSNHKYTWMTAPRQYANFCRLIFYCELRWSEVVGPTCCVLRFVSCAFRLYTRAPVHTKQPVSIKNNSGQKSATTISRSFYDLTITSPERKHWRCMALHRLPDIWPIITLCRPSLFQTGVLVPRTSFPIPVCRYSEMSRLRLLHLLIFRTSAWRTALFWAHPNLRQKTFFIVYVH